MLGKLIKHEFKATSRIIPFIYLTVAVFTVMSFIGRQLNFRVTVGLADLITGIAASCTCIATLVIIAMRFYKSMFDREGYLTLTLPATRGQLLFSKALVSAVWLIASVIVTLIPIFMQILTNSDIKDALASFITLPIFGVLSPYYPMIILFAVISALLTVFGSIAQIYFSVTLGNTGYFHKRGASVSILIFLGVKIVTDIITAIVNHFIPYVLIINKSGISLSLSNYTQMQIGIGATKTILSEYHVGGDWFFTLAEVGTLITESVLTAVLFAVAYRLLKRKICLK